jgi:hypothetical protein
LNTVIIPAQEALSADTRRQSADLNRWIEAKCQASSNTGPAHNN